MKNLKKLAALVLAMLMMLSLVPSFADEETQKGTIIVNNVSSNTTYKIYKILTLESYADSNYSYSIAGIDEKWKTFFEKDEVKKYITIDSDTGYVKAWVAADDDSTVAAFAKLALEYANTNEITPTKSSANNADFTVTESTTVGKFENLDLGYYLVDSNAGALCGLSTTNLVANIRAKNVRPVLTKQVFEDGTQQWDVSNSANIGQEVLFRVTIEVGAGAENYVMHDNMHKGFTLTTETEEKELLYADELKVTHVDNSETDPNHKSHEMEASLYHVNLNPKDGCVRI